MSSLVFAQLLTGLSLLPGSITTDMVRDSGLGACSHSWPGPSLSVSSVLSLSSRPQPSLTTALPSSCQRNVSARAGDLSDLEPEPNPRTVMSDWYWAAGNRWCEPFRCIRVLKYPYLD